jgi:cysteine desulfurase
VTEATPVYLDHAASTPLDAAVTEAVLRALACQGSPDALHPAGTAALELLEHARAQVAALIGAHPDEVLFTAGATEARNLAVKGLLSANRALGCHAVASMIEHPAVLSALRSRMRDGDEVTFVGVDSDGHIAPEVIASAITPVTALASIHHAQHEIGTIQDLALLIPAMRDRREDVRIHVDATASVGVIEIDVAALGADALSLGGTALGAPAWTGALWLRPGARLHPLIEGGAQEFGKRAGPVDLAGAVALGVAAERVRAHIVTRAANRRRQTRLLADRVLAVPDVRLNGPPVDVRLPGNLQVSVRGITGESLALALATRGVYVSPGSTCTADAGKASPTLEAIGCGPPWTHSAILMTIGDTTTDHELLSAGEVVASVVADLRAMSPLDA